MNRFFLLSTLVFAFAGCNHITPTMQDPDNSIVVAPSADGSGSIAVPPACIPWSDNPAVTWDNQPVPQYGCASARNLAIMVEQPEDLMAGRDISPGNANNTANSMRFYYGNQTRGMIDPAANSSGASVTTAPATMPAWP